MTIPRHPDVFKSRQGIRVDFLGPPGIGKTMLHQVVLKHADVVSGPHNWIDMKEARRIAERNAFRHIIPSMHLLKRFRLLLSLFRHGMGQYMLRGWRRSFICSRELDDLQKQDLHLFLKKHGPLFDTMATQWFDPDQKLPPLAIRYDELLQWTSHWLFCVLWAGRVRILSDNSRFTRGVAELLSNDAYGQTSREEIALDYFRSPLGPDAIVHVEGEPNLIVDRILDREEKNDGRRNVAHQGLSSAELLAYCRRRIEVNTTATAFFKARGIKVLPLRAEALLAENIHQLITFLHRLTD